MSLHTRPSSSCVLKSLSSLTAGGGAAAVTGVFTFPGLRRVVCAHMHTHTRTHARTHTHTHTHTHTVTQVQHIMIHTYLISGFLDRAMADITLTISRQDCWRLELLKQNI